MCIRDRFNALIFSIVPSVGPSAGWDEKQEHILGYKFCLKTIYGVGIFALTTQMCIRDRVAGVNLVTFQDMVDALQKRHDFFTENGCKLSDRISPR